jgi:hypothetical protein
VIPDGRQPFHNPCPVRIARDSTEARFCGIWRATCPRHDIRVDLLTRATTFIGSETAISQQRKSIEVRVYRDSSLRQAMTHPPGDPSKIAAGASASRLSPTEAEGVRTACLRAWRY